ncbi:hypothetical protein HPB50_003688 [Hyalomma asiaticum]|uniref:Uncharacterized protein n=1 Tax=Hyalomma asiaticum TaxID=266040 RepID=A0ACB7SSX3_HYAAI|nr:hypothetical protein HPB50_003688 [Hyalomma asiaticum]
MEGRIAAPRSESAVPLGNSQPIAKPPNSAAADRDGNPTKTPPEGAKRHVAVKSASTATTSKRRPSRKGAVIDGDHSTTAQHCVSVEERNRVAAVVAAKWREYARGNADRGKTVTGARNARPRRNSTSLCLCVVYLVALLVLLTIALHAAHSSHVASRKHPKLLVASPTPQSTSSSPTDATQSLPSETKGSDKVSSEDDLELLATTSLPSSPENFSQEPEMEAGVPKKAPLQYALQEAEAGESGAENSTEASDVEVGGQHQGRREHRPLVMATSATLSNDTF